MNNPVVDLAKEKTVTANMDEAGTLTMKVLASVNDFCDDNAGHVAYTSLTFITEADNGKAVCYRAEDTAGNVSYKKSYAIAGIDTTAPGITINNPDPAPALTKTVSASITGGSIWQSIVSDTTCDDSLTFTAYAPQTFSLEADNGKRVCYKGTDVADNTYFALSEPIQGIVNCAEGEMFQDGACVVPAQQATVTLGDPHADGIVFQCADTACNTGVVARQADSGSFDWDTANSTCSVVGTSWRLPTMPELRILYSQKDATYFGNFSPNPYWSGNKSSDSLADMKAFDSNGNEMNITTTFPFSARCVKNF